MPTPLFRHRSRTTGGSGWSSVVWDGSAGDENWSTGANWDTASAPDVNDYVYISATASDISNGLSQSAINLNQLHFGSGWTGDINGTLAINSGLVVVEKRLGDVKISGVYDRVIVINTAAGPNALTIGGTIRQMHVFGSRGKITISDSATVGSMTVTPSYGREADISIGSSCTISGTIRVHDRTRLTSASTIPTLIAKGFSEITMTGSATVTSFTIADGCRYTHTSSGTISGGTVWGDALFRLKGNTSSSVTVNALQVKGGTVDARTGTNALTVGTDWTYYKGRLIFDPGYTLDVVSAGGFDDGFGAGFD